MCPETELPLDGTAQHRATVIHSYFIFYFSTIWNCFTEPGRGRALAGRPHPAQPLEAMGSTAG